MAKASPDSVHELDGDFGTREVEHEAVICLARGVVWRISFQSDHMEIRAINKTQQRLPDVATSSYTTTSRSTAIKAREQLIAQVLWKLDAS